MERWLVVLILGDLVFVGCLLWLFASYRLRRERSRMEERSRLLERFTTGQELSDFLSSAAGERYFKAVGTRPFDATLTLARSIATGVILMALGAGFLILAWAGVMDAEPFYVPGTLLGMAGIGVLISAAISVRLLRRSGLLSRDGGDRDATHP